MSKPNIYQEVTDRMIALLEAGADGGDWKMPFRQSAAAGLPVNAVTKRRYRGINIISLWGAAQEHGFPSNRWATYRQWAGREDQVAKGERGERIVFFRVIERKNPDDPKGEKQRFPMLRFSTVFNEAQIEGYTAPLPEEVTEPPVDRIGAMDEFIAATGADVREASGRAFYRPAGDYVSVPPADDFDATEDVYSVAFHELTHWTGHESRLARDGILKTRFGSESYAMEELVAELGSAFLCGTFEIEPQPREDHAKYLANWLTVLRDDNKAIVTAASKASDAADLLRELGGDPALESEADGRARPALQGSVA